MILPGSSPDAIYINQPRISPSGIKFFEHRTVKPGDSDYDKWLQRWKQEQVWLDKE